MEFSWRVTKYNPQKRDENDNCLDYEEWTSFSDIGNALSEEDYMRTESNYVNAISTFLDEMGLKKLYITNLELWSDGVASQNASSFLSKMWVGKGVTTKEIRELVKLTLRDVIWCKLSYKKDFFCSFWIRLLYVHWSKYGLP